MQEEDEPRWFLMKGDEREGPLAKVELIQQILTLGRPREVPIWCKGMPSWTRAGETPGVAEELPPPFVDADPAAPTNDADNKPGLTGSPATPASSEARVERFSRRSRIGLYLLLFAVSAALLVANYLTRPKRNEDASTAGKLPEQLVAELEKAPAYKSRNAGWNHHDRLLRSMMAPSLLLADIKQEIIAARQNNPNTLVGYVDMYRKVRPLVRRWRAAHDRFRTVAEGLAPGESSFGEDWKQVATAIRQVATLDGEHLELLESQVELIDQMEQMPSYSQLDFLNSNVLPLMKAEIELVNRQQKNQATLMAALRKMAKGQ